MLSLNEQALAWYVALTSDEDVTEVWRLFQIWWRVSPENRQAFREIEDAHRPTDCTEALPEPQLTVQSPAVEPLMAPSTTIVVEHGPKRARKVTQLLMSLCVVPLAFVPVDIPVRDASAPAITRVAWSRALTGRSERLKTFRLSDGSTVQLSADTVIDWRMTRERRELTLERGRAEFTVSRDERPFEVKAGTTQVVALGTIFSVTRDNEEIVTVVKRGEVVVMPVPSQEHVLAAGQTAWVRGDRFRMQPDPSSSDSWLELENGDFNFFKYPLSEAVAAFNDYHNKQRLEIVDPLLRAATIGGQFPANNPQRFARALERLRIASIQGGTASDSAVIRLQAYGGAETTTRDSE